MFPYPGNAIKVAELGEPGAYQAGVGLPATLHPLVVSRDPDAVQRCCFALSFDKCMRAPTCDQSEEPAYMCICNVTTLQSQTWHMH